MNTSINGLLARVSLAFALLINTQLIAFARNVVTLLTGNAQYPTPNPALTVVTTAINAFETALHDALDGGRLLIATRNALREELLTLMRQLAAYVQGHCDGDLVALLSSGFDAIKAKSPSYLPDIPGNQRLAQNGSSGTLTFSFDRVANALNYSIQSATSPDGPWGDRGLSTKIRVAIDNLTPGKVYWARACANGSAGSSDFGGPATAMAL
ncbi:MAG: hypothetical protein ACR2HH_03390 [Chthoniobacterales bacterium]